MEEPKQQKTQDELMAEGRAALLKLAKIIVIAFVSIAALMALPGIVGMFTEDAPPVVTVAPMQRKSVERSPSPDTTTVEYIIASTDIKNATLNAAQIAPYKIVLDRLQTRCSEPRPNIGALAILTQQLILSQSGNRILLLKILNGTEQIVRPMGEGTACSDVFREFVGMGAMLK